MVALGGLHSFFHMATRYISVINRNADGLRGIHIKARWVQQARNSLNNTLQHRNDTTNGRKRNSTLSGLVPGGVGDPIFGAFYATQVPFQDEVALAEELNRHAYTKLIEGIEKAYLLVHSQAGAFGWLVGDKRPDLVRAIVSLEPVGAPFVDYPWAPGTIKEFGITKIEIQYEPYAGPNGTQLKSSKGTKGRRT